MVIVEQRQEGVPLRSACEALCVSRASLYRSRNPSPPARAKPVRPPSPRRLGDSERRHLLEALHRPEFVSLATKIDGSDVMREQGKRGAKTKPPRKT